MKCISAAIMFVGGIQMVTHSPEGFSVQAQEAFSFFGCVVSLISVAAWVWFLWKEGAQPVLPRKNPGSRPLPGLED